MFLGTVDEEFTPYQALNTILALTATRMDYFHSYEVEDSAWVISVKAKDWEKRKIVFDLDNTEQEQLELALSAFVSPFEFEGEMSLLMYGEIIYRVKDKQVIHDELYLITYFATLPGREPKSMEEKLPAAFQMIVGQRVHKYIGDYFKLYGCRDEDGRLDHLVDDYLIIEKRNNYTYKPIIIQDDKREEIVSSAGFADNVPYKDIRTLMRFAKELKAELQNKENQEQDLKPKL